MTIEPRTASGWRGWTAVDQQGERIGTVEAIYLDQWSGKPEWALIHTGSPGAARKFVHLSKLRKEQIDVECERR